MSPDDRNPGDDALEDLEPTESDTGEVKGGSGKHMPKQEIDVGGGD